MLNLIIKAQIPLVAVTTRDVLNFPEVVRQITGVVPHPYVPSKVIQPDTSSIHVYTGDILKLDLQACYHMFVSSEKTLLVVNPSKILYPLFNLGEVTTPRESVISFLEVVTHNKDRAVKLSRSLGGCTLKETAEYVRITMARDGSLTPIGLSDTRRSVFQALDGLTHVRTFQEFYNPDPSLSEWLNRERTFFLDCPDYRLVPRGLLLDGPPGTGKTAGAKYIANTLGIPLYRLDLAGTKNKYVGNSEANLLKNLQTISSEAPCVVLMDEIEKVMSSKFSDNTGVTSTMLSQLLWWLAEHRDRVLTVMTTNNASLLPPELYRDGRIDCKLVFKGLCVDDLPTFIQGLLATFGIPSVDVAALEAIMVDAVKNTSMSEISQASVTSTVMHHIKYNPKISKYSKP